MLAFGSNERPPVVLQKILPGALRCGIACRSSARAVFGPRPRARPGESLKLLRFVRDRERGHTSTAVFSLSAPFKQDSEDLKLVAGSTLSRISLQLHSTGCHMHLLGRTLGGCEWLGWDEPQAERAGRWAGASQAVRSGRVPARGFGLGHESLAARGPVTGSVGQMPL